MDAGVVKFSIITCTYNPDSYIFRRLISALEVLILTENCQVEWIIVDNNSEQVVENSFNFSTVTFPVIHIKEPKPGLTEARIAGAYKAKGDWLIFFDDDNEPAKNYLTSLLAIISTFPEVGCWGPGVIDVEFVGVVKDKWVVERKDRFQQKKVTETIYGNEKGWQPYYPIGTGLVVKKGIVKDYIEKIKSGKYTLTDRKGKSLISGGDTQIVLNAQKNGYACGISPDLMLKHLISANKAKPIYLFKQKYWTASSYVKCYNEVYEESPLELTFLNNFAILKLLLLTFYNRKLIKRQSLNNSLLDVFEVLGNANARYAAADKRIPFMLRLIETTI